MIFPRVYFLSSDLNQVFISMKPVFMDYGVHHSIDLLLNYAGFISTIVSSTPEVRQTPRSTLKFDLDFCLCCTSYRRFAFWLNKVSGSDGYESELLSI